MTASLRYLKISFLSTVCIFCASCINYESKVYHKTEVDIIEDLLIEMISYGHEGTLLKGDFIDKKVLIIATLDTFLSTINNPIIHGYFYAPESTQAQIENRKAAYDKAVENFRAERKHFGPLISGALKARRLSQVPQCPYIVVELLNRADFTGNEITSNEIGYLMVSRVILDRSMKKGFLSYTFYCGEACLWDNNIEIEKVDGQWIIRKYWSGGIA